MPLCSDTCCASAEDGSQDFKNVLWASSCRHFQVTNIWYSTLPVGALCEYSLLFNITRTDSPPAVKHYREKVVVVSIS